MKSLVKFINKRTALVLIFLLLILSGFYNIHKTSFLRPQGLHQWRQSLGATYAKNYYNHDLKISETRINNYIVDNGESDVAFAEFPILYYFIAILYKIFGPNESIFRIVNLLIMYLGLLYLMKLFQIILKDNVWSLLLTILTFTSATLIYYSNSFLPDTTAFAITFIALYHIGRYSISYQMKYIWYASFLFALGGLLKATSLVPFFAVSGTFILYQLFSKDFRKEYKILKFVIPILIPILLSFLWYLFVSIYHGKYGGNISPVEIRPIWRLTSEIIDATWDRIRHGWLGTYYHVSILVFALISFVISLYLSKNRDKFLMVFMILSLIGSTMFFFLFFRSLRNHDYYLIVIFFLVIFSIALFLKYILKSNFLIKYDSIIKLLFAGLIVFYAIDAKPKVSKKLNVYNSWHQKWFHGIEDIEPLLLEAGINEDDKVICIPDPSINISLNMINRPGFTDYGFTNLKGADRIEFFIQKGAKYLMIFEQSYYDDKEKSYLKPYLKNKILTYKNVDVYDLQEHSQNKQ